MTEISSTPEEEVRAIPEFQYHAYRYWLFENAIPPEICDQVLALADGKWEEGNTDLAKGHSDKRKSDVVFVNEAWLYEEVVFPFVYEANEASGWNIELDAAEACQIARYEEGGHYDFHFDGTGLARINLPTDKYIHNKTRKMSVSVILNDDYEGGDFEFFDDPEPVRGGKGTVIVFPSYHVHRVTPVTKGTRYSLVTWVLGEPFK